MNKIKSFGQVKEVIGAEYTIDDSYETVSDLKELLNKKFPVIQWSSVAVALNKKYASGEDKIEPNDEIALIPPVSGG